MLKQVDEISVCTTCWITFNTGFDESLILMDDKQEAEQMQVDSDAGLRALQQDYELTDTDNYYEFIVYECECCGSVLAGSRYGIALWANEEENLHSV